MSQRISVTRDELISKVKDFVLHIRVANRSLDVWDTICKSNQKYPEVFNLSQHFFRDVASICASSSVIETVKLFDTDQKSFRIYDLISYCNAYENSFRPLTKSIKNEIKSRKSVLKNMRMIRSQIMAHTDRQCGSYESMTETFDRYPFTFEQVKELVEICENACNAILESLGEAPLSYNVYHTFFVGDLNYMADLANQQWQCQKNN